MPSLALPDQSSLYYLDENPTIAGGNGRAVLLLHGLGATSDSWIFQIPTLTAAGFRVLAVDTPGFGRSRAACLYHSVADIAAFIPLLLDYLSLTQVSVVGISMGGTQALQFAVEHPASVDRLILVNTFARLDLSTPRNWPYFLIRLTLLYTRGIEAQAHAVARRVFPEPGQQPLRFELVRQVLQAQPGVYRSAMLALSRFNLQARLGEISAPALVITGDRDDTVPMYVQRRLAQGLRAAQHAIIANAGHAVSVEQPDEFNRLVLNFLCSQPAEVFNPRRLEHPTQVERRM